MHFKESAVDLLRESSYCLCSYQVIYWRSLCIDRTDIWLWLWLQRSASFNLSCKYFRFDRLFVYLTKCLFESQKVATVNSLQYRLGLVFLFQNKTFSYKSRFCRWVSLSKSTPWIHNSVNCCWNSRICTIKWQNKIPRRSCARTTPLMSEVAEGVYLQESELFTGIPSSSQNIFTMRLFCLLQYYHQSDITIGEAFVLLQTKHC